MTAAMNPVLTRVLASRSVTAGGQTLPLQSSVSEAEGALLQRIIAAVKPTTTLEVGMAYGVSTLFICDALARHGNAAHHHVIDPHQHSEWRGIGIAHVREAGYAERITLHEEGSEVALPRLLGQGFQIEFAFIDGFHTFDHTLIDFFYINKMLSVGGAIVIDDVQMPSVHRVVRHVLTYPAYELMTALRPTITPTTLRHRIRRRVARSRLAGLSRLALGRDDDRLGTMVAVRKVAPDARAWNWWADF
jgi:predicted O-methyltransferase YrrM